MNVNISLYRNIGYLAYAIATSFDGHSKESIQLMKNDLIKSWYYLTQRDMGNDSETSIQTELIFNWLISHGFSSKYAWESFAEFIKNHSSRFEVQYKEDLLMYSADISSKLYTTDQSDIIIEKVSKILSL
ncbi:MAG TPA: hypothetical protein VLZ75_08450 [Chitinophagales bacterium]|nr:hypothetical protein [Chitinophagales bacterium]